MDEVEDFFDRHAYPEFEGTGFEIIEEAGVGGIWIVLPEGMTKAEVIDIFKDAGWKYNEEVADIWCAEFESPSGAYVIYSEDLDTEIGRDTVTDAYGITIPKDGDTILPAILLY